MEDGLLEAFEASVETGLNRAMSSYFSTADTEDGAPKKKSWKQQREERRRREHEAYQQRVKEDAELWAGRGLGLLPDGSVPKSGFAIAKHAVRESCRGLVRGVVLGGTLKGSLSLLLALFGGALKKQGGILSALQGAMGPDTQQFAAFLGALVGAFRGVNALATGLSGKDSPKNAAVAGAVAGTALLLDETSRRQMIALYLFSRGLDVACKRLVRDGVLPYWRHFEALLFGLSNCPIMFGFLFDPSILQQSYYKWILRMGVVTDEGLKGTLRDRREHYFKTGELIPFRHCSHGYHDGPCTVHCTVDWFAGLLRALKIYLPVHLVPLVLFRSKALVKDPKGTVLHTAVALASSCAFLSTYVFCVKSSQCFLRNARHVDAGWHALVAGMLTGLSTYLEQPSRISELMLYCLPRGLEATWIYMVNQGWVYNIKNFEAAFMSAAMAMLISASKADFKRTYYNTLCFLLGSESSVGSAKKDDEPLKEDE